MAAVLHDDRTNFARRLVAFALMSMMILAGCAPSQPSSETQQSTSASQGASASGSLNVPAAAATSSLSSSIASASASSAESQASRAASKASSQSSSASANTTSKSRTAVATSSQPAVTQPATPATPVTPSQPSDAGAASQSSSISSKTSESSAASSAPEPEASLNLDSLEQRLRDTKAIGLFTKLSLKNQVDDLLSAFRAHYSGKSNIPLSDLRQRYDLLLMKILTLLQDSDTHLAADIRSSREAIWDILKDPKKFAEIS